MHPTMSKPYVLKVAFKAMDDGMGEIVLEQ